MPQQVQANVEITHEYLPDEQTPWVFTDVPPTSHISHEGVQNVVDACIVFVHKDFTFKTDFTTEIISPESFFDAMRTTLKSHLIGKAKRTSPDSQTHTDNTIAGHVKQWINEAFPTNDEIKSLDPITSEQELSLLVLTTLQHVFETPVRPVPPTEKSNPLPDKHDYTSVQSTDSQTDELIQLPLTRDDFSTILTDYNNEELRRGHVSVNGFNKLEKGIAFYTNKSFAVRDFAEYASKRIDDNRSFEVFNTAEKGGTYYFSLRLPEQYRFTSITTTE